MVLPATTIRLARYDRDPGVFIRLPSTAKILQSTPDNIQFTKK